MATEILKASDPGNASIFHGVLNSITGNLDYQRQIASAVRAEEVSAREAQKAREFSAAEAEKNRQWQERLSNTAYSRAIADLRKNGINPYAIGSFQSANVPSGSTAQASVGSAYQGATNRVDGLGSLLGIVSSAQASARESAGLAKAVISIIPAFL